MNNKADRTDVISNYGIVDINLNVFIYMRVVQTWLMIGNLPKWPRHNHSNNVIMSGHTCIPLPDAVYPSRIGSPVGSPELVHPSSIVRVGSPELVQPDTKDTPRHHKF